MSVLNWDDLKIFLAVARARKLSSAARTLGIDATTVSRRIERLAADLQTTLFEPSAGGQTLTEAGGRLLAHAEAIERAALAARADVGGERGLLSGVVRVSVAEGFGTWIIARHLGAFRKANPEIIVELIASSGFLNPSKREADLAVMLARPTSGPLLARRLGDGDEGHQVHAFVFGFFHQGADPAVIILHPAQRGQVLNGGADHAGHTGNGFQHDGAVAVTLGEEGIGGKTQDFGETKREMIRKAARRMMDARLGIALGSERFG